jgi:hypothetical protein
MRSCYAVPCFPCELVFLFLYKTKKQKTTVGPRPGGWAKPRVTPGDFLGRTRWTACSQTCGTGARMRTRTIAKIVQGMEYACGEQAQHAACRQKVSCVLPPWIRCANPPAPTRTDAHAQTRTHRRARIGSHTHTNRRTRTNSADVRANAHARTHALTHAHTHAHTHALARLRTGRVKRASACPAATCARAGRGGRAGRGIRRRRVVYRSAISRFLKHSHLNTKL